ncbi:MAG: YfhO family protein, partial [Acidobacteriota bacterium]|nr:YfhO family protein [Acidobacteriota bacterium]
LDNVGYDSLTTRPGFAREQTIFNSRSHVLDLLNTRFVLAYSNPLYAEGTFTTRKEGIKFSETDDPVDIKPGETVTLETESIEADTLALVTSLSNSSGEIDGSTVARLRVSTADGRTLEHSLRAGVDTAEWAHERADVRSVVRHRLAKVFNSRPGDQSGSFQAHTYLARIPFGERLRVKHVEIVNVKQAATLVVWKGTFYDSAANYSVPLMNPLVGGNSDRWQLRKPKLPTLEKEGIRFSGEDDAVELGPGETVKVMDVPAEGDTMVLVTSLAHAANEKDQAPVAKLRLRTSYGQVIEHDLRAGVETAEWAHDRPDVRAVVLHHLAPVFDSRQEGSVDGFPAYRYWARIKPGKRVGVREAEIVNTSAQAVLTIWKATLYDAVTRRSTPFSFAKPDRWQPVYEKDNVIILENQRALPRAWLVAEAEVIDSEEALRAIRGEGGKTFDPKRTALVETSPETLPALPGGQISSSASATISLYEPNRLTIKTTADSASMLVVSEVAYPGWHATLDGAEVPIFVTNYLLRGVAVPSGSHVVEMRYTAPRARKGLIISVSILITFAGILVYARRRRGQLSEKAFPHLPLNS